MVLSQLLPRQDTQILQLCPVGQSCAVGDLQVFAVHAEAWYAMQCCVQEHASATCLRNREICKLVHDTGGASFFPACTGKITVMSSDRGARPGNQAQQKESRAALAAIVGFVVVGDVSSLKLPHPGQKTPLSLLLTVCEAERDPERGEGSCPADCKEYFSLHASVRPVTFLRGGLLAWQCWPCL